MKHWARLFSLPFITLLAVASFAGERNPLIQNRVNDLLDRAETSMSSGRFEEAVACTEAILLKPIVNVYVDTKGLPDSEMEQAEEVTSKALSTWEESLNYEVTFMRSEESEADIKIGFRDSVYHLGRSVAGIAVWSRQVYNWGNRFTSRVSAEIKIRTHDENGQLVSPEAMLQTSLHEVGHVLGLWDSARVGDVMGPLMVSRPVTKPTEREIEALLAVRNRAVYVSQGSLTALKRSR